MLSTLWFTDSLMSSAVIVGNARDTAGELERALGELVGREDLADHPEPVRLVDVERVAGEHQLLRLARTELPRVREVLHAAHAEPGADHVGEARVLGRDDEVARPHEHQAGRVDRAVDLGDRDLAQVAPALRVLEEVVPLLEHPVLGALARAAVDRERGVRVGAARALRDRFLRAEVVARREDRARAAEDDHADGVVGLRPEERVVELHEQPAVLRVAALLAAEHDPRDRAVVHRLVRHVLVAGCFRHSVPLDGVPPRAAADSES